MKTTRRNMLKMLGTGAVGAAMLPFVSPAQATSGRKLFESADLGGLQLKNRIVRAPTSMEVANHDGTPSEQVLRIYEDVAKGGSALVITGFTYVRKADQPHRETLGLYDDSQIPAFRKLADVIKNNGAKACLQIGFSGSFSGYDAPGREIWGPSPVPHPWTKVVPTEMTKDNIKTLIKAMADGALRAKKAGFDAIELHYCHTFLINQFMNPAFNQRTDEYGGSVENRARLGFEVLEAVRGAVGPDYPVFAKVMGQDYSEPGQTLKEGIFFVKGLAERGLSAVDISGGMPIRPDVADDEALQAYFEKDATAIARDLDIPIILTGGHREVKVMERVLNANAEIAALGLSRTILSEPDVPNKWMKDAGYEAQCISCNQCIANYGKGPTVCVLNG